MTGSESRNYGKLLLQSLETWTLPSQYILSLMKLLSHILEIYTFNCIVCGTNPYPANVENMVSS
jgi:hypothetical protein